MIIGSGMLANTFLKYNLNTEVLIFASGVSNSKGILKSDFKREELLLLQSINQNIDKIIVYFSTCSIYDTSVNKSDYVLHKLNMENIIQNNCKNFYIFRLPQVVGRTDSPTLINFLFSEISNNKKLTINKNSTRNLISSDDVLKITDYIISNEIYSNEIINIATPYNLSVIDIVFKIENTLNKKAIYELLDIGEKQNINIDKIKNLEPFENILNQSYIQDTLNKYYLLIQKEVLV